MRQTTLMIAVAVLGLAAAAPTQAQNGLLAPTATTNWPQWQGRVTLGLSPQTLTDNTRLRGSSLLGDYYFYRHPVASPKSPLGGFRATSGLMWGASSLRLLTGLGTDLTSGRSMGLSGTLLSLQPQGWSVEKDNAGYLGLGYTLMSLRGGWGLSADIGLASTTRSNTTFGSGLGLGRSSLEDSLRDSRLTPLLHLGLSYSF